MNTAQTAGPVPVPVPVPLPWPCNTGPPVLVDTDTVNNSQRSGRRSWQELMDQGERDGQHGRWEHALGCFNDALAMCNASDITEAGTQRSTVLYKLGTTNRRFGRYEIARSHLENAVSSLGPSTLRIECGVELAVIYRHLERLEDAKNAFELQYNTAKQLDLKQAACRAVGNLGMLNYQIWQQTHEEQVLQLATAQLQERIERARKIQDSMDTLAYRREEAPQWLADAIRWEVVGASRLSLCFLAGGDAELALKTARSALELTMSKSNDATMVGVCRFFYGHALLHAGYRDLAMEQFDPSDTECTAAMALCKEPTSEHCRYVQELVEVGADMTRVDENGYSALDYAVFGGDLVMQKLVLEGLRRQLTSGHQILQEAAELRKCYREIFQETMRPVLSNNVGAEPLGKDNRLQELRVAYANLIAGDNAKRRFFEPLKYVPYSDFIRQGRMPRYDDKTINEFNTDATARACTYFVFISYRWLNKVGGISSPDDLNNQQHNRMLHALEGFLELHPSVQRESVGIWLDHACVDQGNPVPGVATLPISVAQCNAIISLVDDEYYDRAWCSLECLMAQTLRRSYGLHSWFEQVREAGVDGGWVLRKGSIRSVSDISHKKLTYEEADRPKITFLSRQVELLG